MGAKHLRRSETLEEEDRISSLQDDLLCRILSLLPTKDTVATSALSTRWKNLFASVTDLEFSDSSTGTMTPTATTDFIDFVTNVISAVLTKSKYIRKLYIYCNHGTLTASLVASWISAVSGPNLQELYVFPQTLIDPVPLPPRLFHCSSLTSLTLRGPFSLCVPEHMLFPSLKKLSMGFLILPDDVSRGRFFTGCVVLEELAIWGCLMDSISVFEVSIFSLKELLLDIISGDYELLLNTPNLESFNFEGFAPRRCLGDRLNSLVEAYLEIYVEDVDFVYEEVSELISMVSNARSLSLRRDSMECLINQTTIFHKLTKLSVRPATASGWLSLPNLLTNAPCLEVLDFTFGLRGDFDEVFADVESYLPEQVPVCVSAHLKEVIFGKFSGEEVEFKIVEYFLKNAEILEKIIISPSPYWDLDLEDLVQLKIEDQFAMTKRLLGFPIWSRACQIDFAYSY